MAASLPSSRTAAALVKTTMKDSWITKIGVLLAVVLVAWNIYKGVTVQEIGIPGFTFKFGATPAAPEKPPADIDVNGRVVDFEKGALVTDADVKLTVAGTTASQKSDSAGSFIFKVPGSESNAVATIEVVATGFETFRQNVAQVTEVQDVYLKHVAAVGGTSGGSPASVPANGGTGATLAEKAQIAKIAAQLPAYQKRRDFVRLIPHK